MGLEKAQALVVRATDWSETSSIVTLWTREWGKVRALAKGGRRLRSNFETSLDLLTLCDIVLLRKTSGSLDLLTEARMRERFLHLRGNLPALYAGYYIAELLGEWTEVHDPHPVLFDQAVAALGDLGQAGVLCGPRLIQFELVLLRELGYGPGLDLCAMCSGSFDASRLAFSATAGGVVCDRCQAPHLSRRDLHEQTWQALCEVQSSAEGWRGLEHPGTRAAIRQILDDYITYLMSRRPKMLSYLES